ncbi:hypothetical protein FOA52_016264 [Chlamydomonas sp. UWO 241]|nr:hypothetical protein FOA52_016264 [Chlamydomonas sp. UWO 241]
MVCALRAFSSTAAAALPVHRICSRLSIIGGGASERQRSVVGWRGRVTATLEATSEAPAAQSPASASYNYFSAWYPVAFDKDLDRARLHRFVLLEIPLVIWWDPNTVGWRVFKDECPHRLVPLSEGRINQAGDLECGYHGWSFSASGACTRIPQGADNISPRACAVAFPAEVRQGLLFVWPQPLPRALGGTGGGAPPDPSLIVTVPELDNPDWVPQDTWRDLPMDWATLMENGRH